MENLESEASGLVLLSGGLDSAVALYWAVSRGWEVATIEFEYYLRPDRERRACRDLRRHAGIRNSIVVPLDFVREINDLPDEVVINSALRLSPEGYIPSRNLVFYALASHYAELGRMRYIIGGHNHSDSESFPDASEEFFAHLNALIKLGMWSHAKVRTQVILPLIDMDKIQVIRLGRALGIPFELTWSCYHDTEAACGTCESCIERRDAFAALNPTTEAQRP